jgi:hypothetical protein
MNFVERELEGITSDILLAGVNQSQLGLYNYNERLLKLLQDILKKLLFQLIGITLDFHMAFHRKEVLNLN